MNHFEQMFPEGYDLGRQLGYPECCIDFFAVRAVALHLGVMIQLPPTFKLAGTGFVPCPHCNATKSEDELRAEIAARRTVSEPFPDYDPEPEMVMVEVPG